jgi:hypothetical protein
METESYLYKIYCSMKAFKLFQRDILYKGKIPRGRPWRRWEDNIKMDLGEIGNDGANWIRLAQDRVQWRDFVNI